MVHYKYTSSHFMMKSVACLILCSLLVAFRTTSLTDQSTGKSLGYLHSSGSQILDSSNHVVGLSGVNWFGFETAQRAPHGLSARNWQEMLDQVKSLGYNVIALTLSN